MTMASALSVGRSVSLSFPTEVSNFAGRVVGGVLVLMVPKLAQGREISRVTITVTVFVTRLVDGRAFIRLCFSVGLFDLTNSLISVYLAFVDSDSVSRLRDFYPRVR